MVRGNDSGAARRSTPPSTTRGESGGEKNSRRLDNRSDAHVIAVLASRRAAARDERSVGRDARRPRQSGQWARAPHARWPSRSVRAVAWWRIERRHRARRRAETGGASVAAMGEGATGQAQRAGRAVRRVYADERAPYQPVPLEDGLQPDS